MKIVLPSFYPPDEDDVAIAIDPDLEYDDAVVNVPLYPDLTDEEIAQILEQE